MDRAAPPIAVASLAAARRKRLARDIAARVDACADGYFAACLEAAALRGMEAMLPADESAARPMVPILTFVPSRIAPGHETVTLGAEEIGEILPQEGDYVPYRVALHGLRATFYRADCHERARAAIERFVNEWLSRLGLFYPGLGVEVRIAPPPAAAAKR